MSYIIVLTNGTQLTTVQDGTLNTTNAGLSLIGKGYTGFGTAFNDNTVHQAENFANTIPPANPLTGQLWYDTVNAAIKLYNGTVFKSISVSSAGPTAPSNASLGDEWFDTINQQLRVYNGSIWVLIGPTSLASSGLNGIITATIIQNGSTYFTADLYANNRLVGKVASDNLIEPNIAGFGNIRPGINFVTSPSSAIVEGGLYNVEEITLGTADQLIIQVDPSTNNPIISSSLANTEIVVRVNNSNIFAVTQTAILPGVTDTISLGSPSDIFSNIYANNIFGNFVGQAEARPGGTNGQIQYNNNGNLAGAGISVDENGQNPFVAANMYVGSNIICNGQFGLLTAGTTLTLGVGVNNAPLSGPTTTDLGLSINYFDSSQKAAFLGVRNSDKNLVYYVNSTTNGFNTNGTLGNITAAYFSGTATSALYADVAERYLADDIYDPGTVIQIGGAEEVTQVINDASLDVFGVISTAPALLMNDRLDDLEHNPAIALVGRVPTKVVGAVKKHDKLVSAGLGRARVFADGVDDRAAVFAYALESNDDTAVKLIIAALTR